MLKIVPDTNILVSAFIAHGNEYEILKLGKLKEIKIIISSAILEEFGEVIRRPKFGFSNKQIEDFIKQVLDTVEIVFPSIKLEIVKEDFEDNRILEAAVETKADYIISGDFHLLKLGQFKDIKIVAASQFLDLIK